MIDPKSWRPIDPEPSPELKKFIDDVYDLIVRGLGIPERIITNQPRLPKPQQPRLTDERPQARKAE